MVVCVCLDVQFFCVQVLVGEIVIVSKEIMLFVCLDDGLLMGMFMVCLEVVCGLGEVYVNIVWIYNYFYYVEGGGLVQFSIVDCFFVKSSGLWILSFRLLLEGGMLFQIQMFQMNYVFSFLDGILCVLVSGGLKYNGFFSFYVLIMELFFMLDINFDLNVCEIQVLSQLILFMFFVDFFEYISFFV